VTREEFVADYARRTGLTAAEVKPCECYEPGCRGWQVDYGALPGGTFSEPEPTGDQ
jgi:hypothetical protein